MQARMRDAIVNIIEAELLAVFEEVTGYNRM